ncbi:hypothetical protein HDU83_008954 [Entophlyctis luteolus]|nr:hypothetical protein HDU83_008954 [Entophlyctis luteolus]
MPNDANTGQIGARDGTITSLVGGYLLINSKSYSTYYSAVVFTRRWLPKGPQGISSANGVINPVMDQMGRLYDIRRRTPGQVMGVLQDITNSRNGACYPLAGLPFDWCPYGTCDIVYVCNDYPHQRMISNYNGDVATGGLISPPYYGEDIPETIYGLPLCGTYLSPCNAYAAVFIPWLSHVAGGDPCQVEGATDDSAFAAVYDGYIWDYGSYNVYLNIQCAGNPNSNYLGGVDFLVDAINNMVMPEGFDGLEQWNTGSVYIPYSPTLVSLQLVQTDANADEYDFVDAVSYGISGSLVSDSDTCFNGYITSLLGLGLAWLPVVEELELAYSVGQEASSYALTLVSGVTGC